ncbi:hypothetical protein LSTR_LSTR009532 [Laodelphax striatellus]|uniref:Galactosylgalactosylxylosylprotein 3-beta-glucuronosyltransferase n=1 Tax=Laodelphax striatellus TaxID=195883 RepID=A0A482XQF5_LAOST|nr:hypothetical protein LSTR_LSTR009532 [Laodelphax striatellus]
MRCIMLQPMNMFFGGLATMMLVCYLTWSTQGREIKRFISQQKDVLCVVSLNDTRPGLQKDDLPVIYFITPTYPRREQVAELIRLGQTLMHVPNLHWILADDSATCNPMVIDLLPRFGLPYTHLASPMPEIYRHVSIVPRGVANRRAALAWIRANIKSGVIYFGDDDNTFDLKLFKEIRDTRKVSMFPVGLIGEYSISSPILKEGKVVGFFDSWPAKRMFPVDMAGFAVNIEFLLQHPNATMPYKAGYEEDRFLRSLGLTLDQIEPKANGCTEVLVWHTQTTKRTPPVLRIDSVLDNSLKDLLQTMTYLGIGSMSDSHGVKTYATKNGKSHLL